DAQREPLPWVNWQGTVYHGLPDDLYGFRDSPGRYLAFVGRICPEKRVDWAIEIAIRSGMPLKIAAKVDAADREYFKSRIERLLDHKLIEFVGEVGESEKEELLGGAHALLFPIDWPEPFGLAMIEAMACGTPVIAFGRGSVPEVVDDGETGFVVADVDDAVEAVERVKTLSRRGCRAVFERRFDVRRMARDYLSVYSRLLDHSLEVGTAA
ncbi:MAG: glycosyltransferase family 4 protein, partial [Candidatus Binatia bacterium]